MTLLQQSIEDILAKVFLRSSKGYTRVGLRRAVQSLISTAKKEARIIELETLLKEQKTTEGYIRDRLKELKK